MFESLSGFATGSLPSALAASFLFGLLGSGHCAGMCGTGMAAMLAKPSRRNLGSASGSGSATLGDAYGSSMSAAPNLSSTLATALARPLAAPQAFPRAPIYLSTGAQPLSAALYWNLGRLGSYLLFGAVAGALSAAAASAWLVGDTMPLRALLFVVANLLVIGVGVQLTGIAALSPIAQPVSTLEQFGQRFWRHLQPALLTLRRAAQSDRPIAQFGAGALWGWIPCGLVYTSLATAMSVAGSHAVSGNGETALIGAAVMLAFGLGTLPMMLALGVAATRWQQFSRQPWLRAAAGTALIVLGVVNLAELPQRTELAKLLQLCATSLGLH